jgi:hypothetical protein
MDWERIILNEVAEQARKQFLAGDNVHRTVGQSALLHNLVYVPWSLPIPTQLLPGMGEQFGREAAKILINSVASGGYKQVDHVGQNTASQLLDQRWRFGLCLLCRRHWEKDNHRHSPFSGTGRKSTGW